MTENEGMWNEENEGQSASGHDFARSRAVPYGAAEMRALAHVERETMGKVDAVLNALTGRALRTGKVEFSAAAAGEIAALLEGELLFRQEISLGDSATHFIAIDQHFAAQIAESLTGVAAAEGALDELELSAVQEVISQACSTCLGQLASRSGIEASGGPAQLAGIDEIAASIGEGALLATIQFEQDGELVQIRHLLPERLADLMLEGTEFSNLAEQPQTPAPRQQASGAARASAGGNGNGNGNGNGHGPAQQPVAAGAQVQYQSVQFGQLAQGQHSFEARNMGILLDVPLEVTVELGKAQLPIRHILEYGQGSLITLDKLAGEPIDLLVNGKYFARGEVVVIDENFGVRITSILSPEERIAQFV